MDIPFRLVQVIWDDAADPGNHKTWYTEADIDEFAEEKVEVVSVGYVKSDTKLYLTIVADCIPNGDGSYTMSRPTKIPHGMISKIIDLVPKGN